MKRAFFALLLAACAHQQPAAAPQVPPADAITVQDSVHGVRYALPKTTDPWQITREGSAQSATAVAAEITTFPLAQDATPASCRERARKRLVGKDPVTGAESPREAATSESPATWSFTTGPESAPVRNRWAFFARGADCIVLHVSSTSDENLGKQAFELASKSLAVLQLTPERQREVDLLAGMGFLERRDPQSALDRFEALGKREPQLAKAHFGALMAGFEIGPPAYARALPHGEAALKAERELSGEQRQLALRAVGVMQLEQNRVRQAADTLAELVVRAPDLAEGQYNYACALARLGEKTEALDHLDLAVRLDRELAQHARDDEDLKTLRDDPKFRRILDQPRADGK